jgi:hypothetical protein
VLALAHVMNFFADELTSLCAGRAAPALVAARAFNR